MQSQIPPDTNVEHRLFDLFFFFTKKRGRGVLNYDQMVSYLINGIWVKYPVEDLSKAQVPSAKLQKIL